MTILDHQRPLRRIPIADATVVEILYLQIRNFSLEHVTDVDVELIGSHPAYIMTSVSSLRRLVGVLHNVLR